MSKKIFSSVFGFLLIILLTTNSISADVDDNEIYEPEYYMMNGVKLYRNDPQCIMLGGVCVHRDDCDELTSKKGLCPSNSDKGVECCYEVPVRPAPCAQHLGECMDRCHKTLMRPGTDCAAGQVCCVLI